MCQLGDALEPCAPVSSIKLDTTLEALTTGVIPSLGT